MCWRLPRTNSLKHLNVLNKSIATSHPYHSKNFGPTCAHVNYFTRYILPLINTYTKQLYLPRLRQIERNYLVFCLHKNFEPCSPKFAHNTMNGLTLGLECISLHQFFPEVVNSVLFGKACFYQIIELEIWNW